MQLFMVFKQHEGGGMGWNSLKKSLNQRLGQKRTWVEAGVESPISAHVSSHGYKCNILYSFQKQYSFQHWLEDIRDSRVVKVLKFGWIDVSFNAKVAYYITSVLKLHQSFWF